ncbi:MAG: nucleotidyltransferase family protein [Bryobacter sp.]|jgi:NDP-sugar pyrophosphorylase family protein|nr:nucleotidyltransferase family protein [Bryobacter sp.]
MSGALYPVAILAGGLATRLRPLTERIPKALLEIAGEPFLFHQLRLLRQAGIRRAVLCCGYLGEMVREYAGDGSRFGVELAYSFDGDKPLGTAGALRKALPLLAERFFTVYGDSYLPTDYATVQRFFERSGKQALMTVFANSGRWDTSNVEYDGAGIVAYDKKNLTERMRHIDYGLGVFESKVFVDLPPDEAVDLADVYKELLAKGRLAGMEVHERFYEIGSWAGIKELTEHLQK